MFVKSYIVEKEEMVSTGTKEFSDFFNFMVSGVSLWVYVTIVPDTERREREYKYFYNAIVNDDLEERKKSAGEEWKVAWSRGCRSYTSDDADAR